MTVLDARPGLIDLLVRPGNSVSLVLDWTASPLAGRTFTAAITGSSASVTVTILSNSMTVLFDGTATTSAAALGAIVPWVLTETTSGSQVRIAGLLRTNTSGATSQTVTATVAVDTITATVTVVGQTGAAGAAGTNGTNGTNGVGVPTGGTTGQALVKNSNTNYDIGFADLATAASVTSEASTRASADTTLQTNITAEASARAAADALKLTTTDAKGPSLIAPYTAINLAAAVWSAANTAHFIRVSGPQVTRAYRYFVTEVGVASGNIQWGVARLSGTSLLNYSVVMDSGVVACPSAGFIRLDLGSVSLTAGDYAIFMWANNTTVTLPHQANVSLSRYRYFSSVASLTGGVPSSGSLADWAGTRNLGAVIEADV